MDNPSCVEDADRTLYRTFPSDERIRSELCGQCKDLNLVTLLGLERDGDCRGSAIRKTFGQLQQDAERCPFCHTIVFAVQLSKRALHASTRLYLRPIRSAGDMHLMGAGETMDGFVILEVDPDHPDSCRKWIASDREYEEASLGFLKCVILEDKRLNVRQPPVKTRAKGTEAVALEFFRRWLGHCGSTHDLCRVGAQPASTSQPPQTRPSRLLKIISNADGALEIKLVDSSSAQGRYVALSYCWGPDPILKTTAASLEAHQKGIPMSKLPQTYLDAIRITHELGIVLIWIDALCIIQDEPSLADWIKESANMNSIFAGAYLTIAAAASESAYGGCYPSHPAKTDWSELPLSFTSQAPDKQRVVCFMPMPAWSVQWTFDREPLQQRGWCLQESTLSRRILYCSSYEYVFICRAAWASSIETNLSLRETTTIHKESMTLLDTYESAWQAGRHWALCLKNYSGRTLSFERDKLIAVQGLVNRFANSIPGGYLFGLWEHFLPWGLLWIFPDCCCEVSRRSDDTVVKRQNMETIAASQRYVPGRAPSWSWASVDSRYEMDTGFPIEQMAYDFSATELDQVMASRAGGFEVEASFLSSEPHSTGMTSGTPSLMLTGNLFKAKLAREQPDFTLPPNLTIFTNVPGFHLETTEGHPWGEESCQYFDDPLLPTKMDEDYLSCFVMPFTSSEWIILTFAGSSDIFRRLGVVRHLYDRDLTTGRRREELSLGPGTHCNILVC